MMKLIPDFWMDRNDTSTPDKKSFVMTISYKINVKELIASFWNPQDILL